MAGTRRSGEGRVNTFRIDEQFYFKHYFEGRTLFERLREFYNNRQYRFEVPPEDFDALRTFLADNGYLLVVVEDLTPYVVVVRKYTYHPENIFKGAVMQRGDATYNYFLMKDEAAVERVVGRGATRLERTGLEAPF